MRAADFAQAEKSAMPWRLPVRHLSASSLIEAATCPEKWRQHHLLGLKDKPTASLTLGSAFHGTCAIYFDEKRVKGFDLPPNRIEEAYHESWQNVLKKEGGSEGIEWGETTPEETFDKGAELTHLYLGLYGPRLTPVSVEEKFTSRLIPGIPVPIVGFIDLTTDGPMIDFKTSSRKATTPKGTWILQGRIYQMRHPKTFDWHIVTKTKSPEIVTPLEAPSLSLPYNEIAVQGIKRYARDLAWTLNYYFLTLGEQEPWPTTGYVADNCRFCSFRERCVAWRR